MKYAVLIIMLFLCECTVLAAEEKPLGVFGYFEPQYTGFSVGGEFLQLGSNKLRVDLARKMGDRVRFEANYDFITYHGETSYNLLDFLPENVREEAPQELVDAGMYRFPFTDRNFLDNAFLRIYFSALDVTVGKQQVSPGTGYAWNPTDLFNIKNILDPTYEQPGHNALRIAIPFGLRTSLTALYAPERTYDASTKVLRLKSGAGHFDYSVIIGERQWHVTDFSAGFGGDARRRLAGLDCVGELFGMGVWLEAAYNSMELSKDYGESVLGMDYTFDNGFYVLAELYHNGQGTNDHTAYTLNSWMRYYYNEIKSIAEDQIYCFCRFPATDLVDIGASIIYAFDTSAAFVPQAMYNLAENLDITIFGNIYAGADGTAYSPLQGSGCLMRARYYF